MLSQPTLDKLKELGLYQMASTLQEQQRSNDLGELHFEERLGLLVDAEWIARQNKRLARRLHEAKLRITHACPENVETSPARGLDKPTLQRLATCAFIEEKMNVLITGPTGTGKTYLACALAQQACRRGYRAVYRRITRLFEELTVARAEGDYTNLLQRLARIDVLVLDDFALAPMESTDRHALLEVLEDRYGNRSTVVASQLPVGKWHEFIAESTLADSICDRLVHNAHRVSLKGSSKRETKGKTEKTVNE